MIFKSFDIFSATIVVCLLPCPILTCRAPSPLPHLSITLPYLISLFLPCPCIFVYASVTVASSRGKESASQLKSHGQKLVRFPRLQSNQNGRGIIFYCTVLHCTLFYCTALHCTVLYCTDFYLLLIIILFLF